MPPPYTLHLIRHAQGVHNTLRSHDILDPEISPHGLVQAEHLNEIFPFKSSVGLVVVSPLRRTLHTALLGMRDVVDSRYYSSPTSNIGGARMLLDPDVQAHSARPCDTGSSLSVIKGWYPELSYVEVELSETWNEKVGPYADDQKSMDERVLRVRRKLITWFKDLEHEDKKEIVIVSHGGMLERLLGVKGHPCPEAGWKSFEVEEVDGEVKFRDIGEERSTCSVSWGEGLDLDDEFEVSGTSFQGIF